MWKAFFVATWLVACAVGGPARASEETPPSDRGDAAVYRRIEQLRRSALRLRLDGKLGDWQPFAQLSDPRGDAAGDPGRDLAAVAIAPTETDLWVMFRTAGRPSTERWAFCVEVDMMDTDDDDFRIGLESADGGPKLQLFDAKKKPADPVPLPHSGAAIQYAAEMRIAYQDLVAALPEPKAQQVRGPRARPWVRVRSASWNGQSRDYADLGPMVGSFRLIATPYPLDTPLPKRPRAAVEIPLPAAGQWFVCQGPMGTFSHQGQWACDLLVLDATGYQSQPKDSRNNADCHAWGRPVHAPVAGQVLQAQSAAEDATPGNPGNRSLRANHVYLDLGGRHGLDLAHLRQGSVRFAPGQRVGAGEQVGAVGNSGYSVGPHLHVAVWQGGFGRQSVPLAFTHVRVGLNPVADDPWARDLPRWEPRYGYFVEPLPATAPSPASPGPATACLPGSRSPSPARPASWPR